jgi:3-hydroxyacyl-CoA dehydrogenase
MSIIKSVLKESNAYYRDVEKKIKKLIDELPKGSIKRRKIGKGFYWYLQKRLHNKIIHKYLGKKRPVNLIKKLAERKRLIKELKKVKLSKKIIMKANKVKNVRGR